MSATADILKAYLVKLGFEVDNSASQKIQKALKDIEQQLTGLQKNKAAITLTKGMFGFVGAVAAATAATVGLMNKVAQSDMEYQKIALRMHMTKDAAKALTIAQETLNASLEEIAWNPKLRKQYHELRGIVTSMKLPPEGQRYLTLIRSIGFEFKKLQVTAKMASERVVYHLGKIMGNDLKKMKQTLTNLNEWFRKNVSNIARIIAEFLMSFIRMGKFVIDIGKEIFYALRAIFNILPEGARGIAMLVAAFAGLMMLNPVIAVLTGLFLLLDDFLVWKHGQDTGKKVDVAFGALWKTLYGLYNKGKSALGDLAKSLGALISQITKLAGTKFDWGKILGYGLDGVLQTVNALVTGIMSVIGILDWISKRTLITIAFDSEKSKALADLEKSMEGSNLSWNEKRLKRKQVADYYDAKKEQAASELFNKDFLPKMQAYSDDITGAGKVAPQAALPNQTNSAVGSATDNSVNIGTVNLYGNKEVDFNKMKKEILAQAGVQGVVQ